MDGVKWFDKCYVTSSIVVLYIYIYKKFGTQAVSFITTANEQKYISSDWILVQGPAKYHPINIFCGGVVVLYITIHFGHSDSRLMALSSSDAELVQRQCSQSV